MLDDPEGRAQYEAACAAFDESAAKFEGEQQEDAVFGVAQLRWVAGKFRPDATAVEQ
jgi:hypothetical protein